VVSELYNPITVVGVDCATKPSKVGMALGSFDGQHLTLVDAKVGSSSVKPVDVVATWIKGKAQSLICLDAPLGWPVRLREALHDHQAGATLNHSANDLFQRLTDKEICERLKKRPLEVGADRIARTSKSALDFLGELSISVGRSIELAWDQNPWQGVRAIEVYPAATRLSWGLKHASSDVLAQHCCFGGIDVNLLNNGHINDAVVCAIAGKEFLLHEAVRPSEEQKEIAMREGWIWAGRKPDEIKR
jgi:predicted nuclease with RNAse H fold